MLHLSKASDSEIHANVIICEDQIRRYMSEKDMYKALEEARTTDT